MVVAKRITIMIEVMVVLVVVVVVVVEIAKTNRILYYSPKWFTIRGFYLCP